MFLTIFVVWMVLAVIAALFMYCCSRVSNGATRERRDSDSAARAASYFTTDTPADLA